MTFYNYLLENNKDLHDILINKREYDDLIKKYDHINFLSSSVKNYMIMNYIKSYHPDMTLKCKEGDIKCHRYILNILPYFNLMFQDSEFSSIIEVDFNYIATKIVIDSIYFTSIENLKINNIYDVLYIMDKTMYNISNVYDECLKYLCDHLEFIIQYELVNDRIDHIKNIERIIRQSHNQQLKLKLKTAFQCCNKYLLSFNKWKEMFTVEQQLDGLMETKQYDLLHELPIKDVIKYMTNKFIYCDSYNKLYNAVMLENINIYMMDKLKDPKKYMYLIKNYYPALSYHSLVNMCLQCASKNENIIKLKFKIVINEIKINSQLWIGNENDDIEQNIYTIVKIFKILNDIEIECDTLNYRYDLVYKLVVDKPIINYNYIFHYQYINEIID